MYLNVSIHFDLSLPLDFMSFVDFFLLFEEGISRDIVAGKIMEKGFREGTCENLSKKQIM